MNPNLTSPKTIVTISLLVLAIVPVGWIAMWSAKNAPLDYVSMELQEEAAVCIAFQLLGESLKGRILAYRIDFKTGKAFSSAIPCEKYLAAGWNEKGVWLASLGATGKCAAVQRIDFANDSFCSVQVLPRDFENYALARGKIVAMNNCNLCLRNDRLELLETSSLQTLDSLTHKVSEDLYLDTRGLPSNRVLIVDRSKSPHCELVEVTNDNKLKVLANWAAIDSYTFQQDEMFYVASLLPDGTTVEVRNAFDGTIVSSITMAPLTMISSPISGSWISPGGFRSKFSVDVFTGRTLPVPSQFELVERDLQNHRLIALSKRIGFDTHRTCIVLDDLTGSELTRFKVDLHVHRAKILRDSNELAFATMDHRVLIFDVRNGLLSRTIDPYASVRWSRISVALAFALWCVAWVRFFASIHPIAWVDSTVCIVAFLGYLTYCSYHDVNFIFSNNLFMYGMGVLVGSVFLACVWMAIGQTRFSLRSLPLLLTFGLAIGFTSWWVAEGPNNREAVLIPGLVALAIGFACLLLPLRWLTFRLIQGESTSPSQHAVEPFLQTRVNLRDIFFLTAVCAILFSIFRWIPLSHWYPAPRERASFLFILGIHFAMFAVLGLFGLWISLNRQRSIWTWGLTASLLLFIVGFSLPILQPTFLGFSAPIGAYLTCLLGFYAYRLRGWRVVSGRCLRRSSFAQRPVVES